MLEMRPVYTSYEREEYLKPFGLVPEDGKTVICARYPDKFVGAAYLSQESESAEILLLSLIDGYENDTDLFLLGKAALNFLDLHGAKAVFFPDAPESLAKKLGFTKGENGVYTLSLNNYFNHEH